MNDNSVLEYIRATAGDEPADLVPVTGGLTVADKYKVSASGREWMVKLVHSDVKRDLWYSELNRHANDRMANPKMFRSFDDGTLCLMSPWIVGESLDSILPRVSAEESQSLGRQAAEVLLQLHKDAVDYPAYAKYIKDRIFAACDKVEEFSLSFPGHSECCAFLRKQAEAHLPQRVCLVHKDVRPENFIFSEGKLYLIDFDNGGLGERAADFPYLTTIVVPEHQAFSRALTEAYLQEADDPGFWQDNLLYSTLQVVEYAIWKWQAKGRQVAAQANNLVLQYNGFESLIPKWWGEN